MKATLHVGAKVSKAKARSVSVALLDFPECPECGDEWDTYGPDWCLTHIDGRPESVSWSKRLDGPGADPSPTAAVMRALAEGLALAALNEATEVEVFCPSKAAIRAMDGTGGAKMETVAAAYATAWSIYITRDLLASWSVEFVPSKLLDDRVGTAAESLFKATAQEAMEVGV